MSRVPDSKSMPKLSCLVANESAPIIRIAPEIEKNHLLAPDEVEVPADALLAGAEERRRAQEARAAEERRARRG